MPKKFAIWTTLSVLMVSLGGGTPVKKPVGHPGEKIKEGVTVASPQKTEELLNATEPLKTVVELEYGTAKADQEHPLASPSGNDSTLSNRENSGSEGTRRRLSPVMKRNRLESADVESYKKIYNSLISTDESSYVDREDYFWDIPGDAQDVTTRGSSTRTNSKYSQTEKSRPFVHQGDSPTHSTDDRSRTKSDIKKDWARWQKFNNMTDQEFEDMQDSIYSSHAEANQKLKMTPEADMYNLIITKNVVKGSPSLQYLPNKEIERMLNNLSTPSVEKLEEVNRAVNFAVAASVGEGTRIQEALTQVIERPGKPPLVNVVKSTIPNLSDLESTIDSLLGSKVVFKEKRSDNTAVGYLPLTERSAVQSLLNQTIGLEYPCNSSTDRTNVVNIFIINVAMNSDESSQRRDHQSKSPSLSNQGHAKVEFSPADNLKRFNNVLRIIHSLPHSQKEGSKLIRKKEIGNQDRLYPVPTLKKPLNFGNGGVNINGGLNLNKNKILNLLPGFIRATTIPPVVPIYNASIYKNLGIKPSVLGLLPNDVFGVMSSEFPFIEQKTKIGLLGKRVPTQKRHSEDEFSQRKLEVIKSEFSEAEPLQNTSSRINSVSKVLPTTQTSKSQEEAVVTQSSIDSPDSQQQDNDKVEEDLSPLDLNFDETRNQSILQILENFMTTSTRSEEETKMETEATNSSGKKENGGTIDTLMKALAIGTVPSSVAFATALFPYWSPLIFGKKRRKRHIYYTKPNVDLLEPDSLVDENEQDFQFDEGILRTGGDVQPTQKIELFPSHLDRNIFHNIEHFRGRKSSSTIYSASLSKTNKNSEEGNETSADDESEIYFVPSLEHEMQNSEYSQRHKRADEGDRQQTTFITGKSAKINRPHKHIILE